MTIIDNVLTKADLPLKNGISAITSFDSSGNIRPIYIKIKGQDSVKIEDVLSVKHDRYAGTSVIDYVCTYIAGDDIKRQVQLRYFVEFHTWVIPGLIVR